MKASSMCVWIEFNTFYEQTKIFKILLPFVKMLYQDNGNTPAWLELKEKNFELLFWSRENMPVLFKCKSWVIFVLELIKFKNVVAKWVIMRISKARVNFFF